MPSIETINLSKKYGSFTALSNLNLKIEGAKCVGFLGPNGAGKTTTLKILCDMIRSFQGKALINGVDIAKDKRNALASCGVLIESPEIYPALTSREALSLFSEIKGIPASERQKQIEKVITSVKMNEWVDSKVGTFSKGMKQRINLAAAIIGNPDVLLLDEPTNGLDPRGMAEFRTILNDLKKDRLIFMSSHLLGEVSNLCDEVAIVNNGKLLVYETMEQLNAAISGDTIFDLTFSRPLNNNIVESKLSGLVSSIEKVNSRSIRVHFSGGFEVQEKIVKLLVSLDTGLIAFKDSNMALEDTYLNLIKDVQ
jgi:ABC-2 type transport system ATP-binding protein